MLPAAVGRTAGSTVCAGSEGRAGRPFKIVWGFSILLHSGQQQTAQCLCGWTVPLMVSIASLGFPHLLAFPLFTHRSRFCRKARLRFLLSGTQYTYVFVVLWVTGITELASFSEKRNVCAVFVVLWVEFSLRSLGNIISMPFLLYCDFQR